MKHEHSEKFGGLAFSGFVSGHNFWKYRAGGRYFWKFNYELYFTNESLDTLIKNLDHFQTNLSLSFVIERKIIALKIQHIKINASPSASIV